MNDESNLEEQMQCMQRAEQITRRIDGFITAIEAMVREINGDLNRLASERQMLVWLRMPAAKRGERPKEAGDDSGSEA